MHGFAFWGCSVSDAGGFLITFHTPMAKDAAVYFFFIHFVSRDKAMSGAFISLVVERFHESYFFAAYIAFRIGIIIPTWVWMVCGFGVFAFLLGNSKHGPKGFLLGFVLIIQSPHGIHVCPPRAIREVVFHLYPLSPHRWCHRGGLATRRFCTWSYGQRYRIHHSGSNMSC